MQSVPRPKELLRRWKLIRDEHEFMEPWQSGSKTIPWATNQEKLTALFDRYEKDVLNDRYSDPVGETMYVERKDGTNTSRRGTNKQEGSRRNCLLSDPSPFWSVCFYVYVCPVDATTHTLPSIHKLTHHRADSPSGPLSFEQANTSI